MDGDAISLVCVDELPLLRNIERLLGRPIRQEVVAGFEPDRTIRPEPIRLRTAGVRPAPARLDPTQGRALVHGAPLQNSGSAAARRPGKNRRPTPAMSSFVARRPGETRRRDSTMPFTGAGRPNEERRTRDGRRDAAREPYPAHGERPRAPHQPRNAGDCRTMPGERLARTGHRPGNP
jgi:ATP-dependent RNA helicase RhlE